LNFYLLEKKYNEFVKFIERNTGIKFTSFANNEFIKNEENYN